MEEMENGVVFRLAKVKEDFPPDSPKLKSIHLEPPGAPKMLYKELRTLLADLSFRLSGQG